MVVKDYYKILELQPNAREDEVKRNFRRLALRFHPDINGGKKQADAWYREIQEAYEVLRDPFKKSKYLQERWLLKSKGLSLDDTQPLTPEFIELKFKAMRINVSQMDHFRMDHFRLQKQLLELCNSANLDALKTYNEPYANINIIGHLLYCMEPLEYNYLAPLKLPMQKIAHLQPELLKKINSWFEKKKREYWWEAKQGWVLAAITLLICAGIAIVTNRSF